MYLKGSFSINKNLDFANLALSYKYYENYLEI